MATARPREQGPISRRVRQASPLPCEAQAICLCGSPRSSCRSVARPDPGQPHDLGHCVRLLVRRPPGLALHSGQNNRSVPLQGETEGMYAGRRLSRLAQTPSHLISAPNRGISTRHIDTRPGLLSSRNSSEAFRATRRPLPTIRSSTTRPHLFPVESRENHSRPGQRFSHRQGQPRTSGCRDREVALPPSTGQCGDA